MYHVSAQGVDERMIYIYIWVCGCVCVCVCVGGGGGGGISTKWIRSLVGTDPSRHPLPTADLADVTPAASFCKSVLGV